MYHHHEEDILTWDSSGREFTSPLNSSDTAGFLDSDCDRTWNMCIKHKMYCLLEYSCRNIVLRKNHSYLKPGIIFMSTGGKPSSLRSLSPSTKWAFLQVVVILIHQSGRRQLVGWRAGLKKIRYHQLRWRCLMICYQKGKSAEVKEVPRRRCFHIKNVHLACLNPLDSGKDEASCSRWQGYSRQNISQLVVKF